MELSPVKIAWGDYENETLIHNHKMSKIYKKRYQRASDFHNSLYRFFGLIPVVASTVATHRCTSTKHNCNTQKQNTPASRNYKTQLQNTFAKHNETIASHTCKAQQ